MGRVIVINSSTSIIINFITRITGQEHWPRRMIELLNLFQDSTALKKNYLDRRWGPTKVRLLPPLSFRFHEMCLLDPTTTPPDQPAHFCPSRGSKTPPADGTCRHAAM